ncbi:hypothetical protein [Deinococcus apachensis]|uniref:hypothetical protein n=1 Tax=Deinococcus apachensis TaxID=309886 RepID=UPI00037386C1|nr:hypothetical protein [Deinococcus apachensis]
MSRRFTQILKCGAAALTLTGPAVATAQTAGTQTNAVPALRLPANYFPRFGDTEVVAGLDGGVSFGVRAFPLPFKQDVRLVLARHPQYWEYGVSTRINDTSLVVGVFDNGLGAAAGIPRLEITYNPYRGLQYSGLLQGNGAYSRFAGGYAFTVFQDRVRVVNNAGVAFQGDVAATYTQTEVGAGYGKMFGKINTSFGVNARLYTFPIQREAQGSLDVSLNANTALAPGLTLVASHFERLVAGHVAIPALNHGRSQETNASLTYRLPMGATPPAFTVGALRTRVTRVWTGNVTTVYGDLLLRAEALPSLFGPSIGYQWAADGTGKWLFSLTFMGK